jgi:hypothetical protein
MNERIRDIKDKLWSEEYWNNPNTDKLLSAQLNRFAELIVRECITVIENKMPDFTCKEDYENLIRKAGRMDAIDEIKQHFGVE